MIHEQTKPASNFMSRSIFNKRKQSYLIYFERYKWVILFINQIKYVYSTFPFLYQLLSINTSFSLDRLLLKLKCHNTLITYQQNCQKVKLMNEHLLLLRAHIEN